MKIKPWKWVPSLYFAQGLPYVIVMNVALVMYQQLGISNADTTLYTSLLQIPWLIKPLWSPIVDILKTKRWWILAMELILGAGLAGIAFSLSGPLFFRLSMAGFVLLAFSSATHDIAIDGFYMLALSPYQQSQNVGLRTTFYRVAMITGQGLLIMVAGTFLSLTGNATFAWGLTFGVSALLFALLYGFHYFVLPRVETQSTSRRSAVGIMEEFGNTVVSFFTKPNIVPALVFLLLFRLAEAQLAKIAPLFMLAPLSKGGLELDLIQQGFIYGTVGVIALVVGGIVGGLLISHYGLRRCLLPLLVAINLPDAVYVYLAYAQPDNLWILQGAVAIEQFGYGLGFSAFLMVMVYLADGAHKTAHYALCTAFMTLGMMLPGMVAGKLQELWGYQHFFIWVMACTVPAFAVLPFLKIDKSFGKKEP